MNTCCEVVALVPTFEELHGVYVIMPINSDSYSHYTRLVMNSAMRELLTYDDFYWTIRMENAHIWEKRLGGEGLNYTHMRERTSIFWLPHCKLDGKELTCKELDIWRYFRAIHLAIAHEDAIDYFIRNYDSFAWFLHTLEDELIYELNPCERVGTIQFDLQKLHWEAHWWTKEIIVWMCGVVGDNVFLQLVLKVMFCKWNGEDCHNYLMRNFLPRTWCMVLLYASTNSSLNCIGG